MPSTPERPLSLLSRLFRFKPDDIEMLIRHILREVRGMVEAEGPIPELTYSDTIAYFVDQRPDDARIVKGAVLLMPKRSVIQVYSLFLDEQNTPLCGESGDLYGRLQRVIRLDDELQEAFDGTKLLILE